MFFIEKVQLLQEVKAQIFFLFRSKTVRSSLFDLTYLAGHYDALSIIAWKI